MGRACFAADAVEAKPRPIEQVRIGLVGIGNRGSWLLRLLLDVEGVVIKAVCDIVPDRVAKAQERVQSTAERVLPTTP